MRYLITGSSGFIGQCLSNSLRRNGHTTIGVDLIPSQYTDFTIDIRNFESLQHALSNYHFDCCFHLAARTDLLGTSLSDYSTNTEGTFNVCKLSHYLPIEKFFFASTQLVSTLGYTTYGYDYKPDTFYGTSKVLSECIINSFFANTNTFYSIFRPTTVWGPGCSSHYRFFLNKLRNGTYIHPTNLPSRKSFSFILNAIYQLETLSLCSDFPSEQTFYLCDYQPVEVYEWASLLALALHSHPPFRLPEFLSKILVSPFDFGMSIGALPSSFPYSSRRISNISTNYVFDVSLLCQYVPSLPYDLKKSVSITADWLLSSI